MAPRSIEEALASEDEWAWHAQNFNHEFNRIWCAVGSADEASYRASAAEEHLKAVQKDREGDKVELERKLSDAEQRDDGVRGSGVRASASATKVGSEFRAALKAAEEKYTTFQ